MRLSGVVVLIGVLAAFFTQSCNRRPKGVLSDKAMVRLVADLETAESYLNRYTEDYPDDEMRDRTMQYILNRNGISKAEYDSTLSWYGRNIDVYSGLLDKVDKELERRQLDASGSIDEEEDQSGTNLWTYSKHFMISPNSASNNLSFSFSPENLTPGDRLEWIFRYKGGSNANIMLGVDYDKGSGAYVYETLYGSKKADINLQTDTARTVKRIYGTVVFVDAERNVLWLDSISLKKLPFDSTQYYKIFSHRHLSEPTRHKKATENSDNTVSDDDDDEADKSTEIAARPVADSKPISPAQLKSGSVLNRPSNKPIKKRHGGKNP